MSNGTRASRRRWTRLGAIAAGLWLLAPGDARAVTIDSYEHEGTSVAPGGDVTIRGSGFGDRRRGRTVRYGRGGSDLGTIDAIGRWGRARIQVTLPSDIAAGRYWLALYDGETAQAMGPESLSVAGGGGPGIVLTPDQIRGVQKPQIDPRGHQQRQIQRTLEAAKRGPHLVILGVTHPGEVRTGGELLLEVRIELRGDLGSTSRNATLVWQDGRARVTLRPGAEEIVRMSRTILPAMVRDGWYSASIEASLDGIADSTVRRDLRIPARAGTLSVRAQINSVHVFNDCDDGDEAGEWYLQLSVRCRRGGRDCGAATGEGPRTDVRSGETYYPNLEVTLGGVPADATLHLEVSAREQDSGWQQAGRVELTLEPERWLLGPLLPYIAAGPGDCGDEAYSAVLRTFARSEE